MAAGDRGVEKRPNQSVSETRVGDVNRDEETTAKVGEVADGVDDATKDLIVHDTTTRDRTVRAKRAHEPLDPDAAEEDQPVEDANGPRAAEVGPSDSARATKGPKVSEAQLKRGADEAQASANAERLQASAEGSNARDAQARAAAAKAAGQK
jgi:hypothetical protein